MALRIKWSAVICSTGNVVGYEGFNKLSEALERNTTISSLNISRLFTRKEKCSDKQTPYLELKWKDNEGHDEGAKALGKMLKVNTTLSTLRFCCQFII